MWTNNEQLYVCLLSKINKYCNKYIAHYKLVFVNATYWTLLSRVRNVWRNTKVFVIQKYLLSLIFSLAIIWNIMQEVWKYY